MVAPFVVDVRLPGVLPPADLARVCAGLAARLRNGAVAAVVCHAESLAGELAAVEALARVSLVARRAGARFSVRGMSPELSSLVELLGLDEPFTAYDAQVRR
jgi:hypothetical protein